MKPNPANQQVEFILKNLYTGLCTITFKNSLNQNVLTTSFNCDQKQSTVDISHLSPGVYAVNIVTNSQYIKSEKLIIVR